jgi:hypothetical protein
MKMLGSLKLTKKQIGLVLAVIGMLLTALLGREIVLRAVVDTEEVEAVVPVDTDTAAPAVEVPVVPVVPAVETESDKDS